MNKNFKKVIDKLKLEFIETLSTTEYYCYKQAKTASFSRKVYVYTLRYELKLNDPNEPIPLVPSIYSFIDLIRDCETGETYNIDKVLKKSIDYAYYMLYGN